MLERLLGGKNKNNPITKAKKNCFGCLMILLYICMCFLHHSGANAVFSAVVFSRSLKCSSFFFQEAHFAIHENGAESSCSGVRHQGCFASIFLQFCLHHIPVWMQRMAVKYNHVGFFSSPTWPLFHIQRPEPNLALILLLIKTEISFSSPAWMESTQDIIKAYLVNAADIYFTPLVFFPCL